MISCKGCIHWQREMTNKNGIGYNPAPYCHLYEDKNQTPDVFQRTCYEKRRKNENTRKQQAEN